MNENLKPSETTYYTKKQAAEILGVSLGTVNRLLASKEIRKVTKGYSKKPRVLIAKQDLEDYMAEFDGIEI